MDNDLMARRLRSPSEPFQPEPQPEQADHWPTDHVTESQSTSETGSASTPAPAQPATRDPLEREDVPWDRPTDYADQTDSATPDQSDWDRPFNADWFDSDPGDDQTTERSAEQPATHEPLAAWPQILQPAVAYATPVIAEVEPQPVSADPDDAYAPVLGDLSVGRAWPGMNDHYGRNDATVAADPATAPSALTEPAPMTERSSMAHPAEEPRAEADTRWATESPGQTSWFPAAVEPTTLAAGLGPTPPLDLFDDGPEAYDSRPEWDPSPAPEAVPSEPEPAGESPTIPAVGQSVSLYSTAAAPATPFVVRIEPSIVDESAPDAGPAWIEPYVSVQPVEQTDWLDPAFQSQPQPPWDDPTPPTQAFADVPAVPPWAVARAPEPAFPPARAPAAPQTPEFAPLPSTPLATQRRVPAEERAPRWAPPAYQAEPVARMPVAQTAATSPNTPAPVAGASAQPAYAEPLDAEPSRALAPQAATVPAQGQSDLWFLSAEPRDAAGAEVRDEVAEGTEPSGLLTGVLTIGMAVLVIVLVLVFIQLMTSLLR